MVRLVFGLIGDICDFFLVVGFIFCDNIECDPITLPSHFMETSVSQPEITMTTSHSSSHKCSVLCEVSASSAFDSCECDLVTFTIRPAVWSTTRSMGKLVSNYSACHSYTNFNKSRFIYVPTEFSERHCSIYQGPVNIELHGIRF